MEDRYLCKAKRIDNGEEISEITEKQMERQKEVIKSDR